LSATRVSDVIVQEITIESPADRIFEALVDPDERLQWWGIEGQFRATRMDSDLQVGGRWKMVGVSRTGGAFEVGGEYREIVRPTLLAFTWSRGLDEDPTETLVRIELEESDGMTLVRVTHSGLVTRTLRDRNSGWPVVLGLLKTHIET